MYSALTVSTLAPSDAPGMSYLAGICGLDMKRRKAIGYSGVVTLGLTGTTNPYASKAGWSQSTESMTNRYGITRSGKAPPKWGFFIA